MNNNMMLSAIIQVLTLNKMKANGMDFDLSNKDHVFYDFYEDRKEMWGGQFTRIMLNKNDTIEKFEENGIVSASEQLYYFDENDDEQIIDVDMENGFPIYYSNGYPLDTDEFEVVNKYKIHDDIINKADEIFEYLKKESRLDDVFSVVNAENTTKFFIPTYTALLFKALEELEKEDVSVSIEEFLLTPVPQHSSNAYSENYLADAFKGVENINTVISFSTRSEEVSKPADWKKTISVE